MRPALTRFISRNRLFLIELFVFLVCLAGLIFFFLKKLLFSGTVAYSHDNYLWNYPLFKYFAENFSHGVIPLWNPFSHGGEPFYPVWGVLKLMDPTSLLGILVGQLFTDNSVLLFNWTKFSQMLFWIFGLYLFLRPVANSLFAKCLLITTLCYSSFILTSFRQDGIHGEFFWAPFVAIQLYRILWGNKNEIRDWVLFAITVGINFQGYHFVSTWLLILFLLLGLAILERQTLKKLFQPGFQVRFGLTTIILLLMNLPNLVLLLESHNYVFPARMVEKNYVDKMPIYGPMTDEGGPENIPESSIRMPYSMVKYSGTFSKIVDFIQMGSPRSNRFIFMRHTDFGRAWGFPSEAYLYLGLAGWLFGLIGLFYGKHPQKKIAAFTLACFFLYMLGPLTPFQQVIYSLYPPAWFLRHTHLVGFYFLANYFYFFVLGLNWTLESGLQSARKLSFVPFKGASLSGFFRFLIYTTIIIETFIWTIDYPEILPQLIEWNLVLIALALYLGMKAGKKDVIFCSLVVAQTLLVLILGDEFWKSNVKSLLGFGFLPVLGLLYGNQILQKLGMKSSQLRCATVLSMASSLILIDLALNFFSGRYIYEKNLVFPDENNASHLSGRMQALAGQPVPRGSQLCIPNWGHRDQEVRYPELIFHIPTVFSPMITKMRVEDCPFSTVGFADLPQDSAMLEDARKNRRWNSFILPNAYFKLVHSRVPTAVLFDIFRIGRSPLFFKDQLTDLTLEKVESLPADELSRFLDVGAPKASEGVSSTGGSTTSIDILSYDPNHLVAKVTSNQGGYLYWADGFDVNWSAKVNSVPSAILQANTAFKAVAIAKGTSTVRFDFLPTYFLAALLIYYALALAAILILVSRFFRST